MLTVRTPALFPLTGGCHVELILLEGIVVRLKNVKAKKVLDRVGFTTVCFFHPASPSQHFVPPGSPRA